MTKKIFMLMIFFFCLFFVSCSDHKTQYSILKNNDVIFNQLGEKNKYLEKEMPIQLIYSSQEIIYGEFTIIIMDQATYSCIDEIKKEFKNLLYTQNKIILIEGNSDLIKYDEFTTYLNFSSENNQVGVQIRQYQDVYEQNKKDKELKQFADKCLNVCKNIIKKYMEKQ